MSDHHPPQKTGWQKAKEIGRKTWHFLWVEDSLASWVANIIVAFVLIKFIFYPVAGWALGTSFPIVAVVSGSMEHAGTFDDWWERECRIQGNATTTQGRLYGRFDISQQEFKEFRFHNGFNKGDLMILHSADNADVGDVLVFSAPGFSDPIIHRIVADKNGAYETKGDANCGQSKFEQSISQDRVLGKALLRIPLLGWIKLGFVKLVSVIGG